MDNSKKLTAILTTAALSSMLAGAAMAQDSGSAKEGIQTAKNAGKKAKKSKVKAHDCAGKNACKGQGGCKTSDNACKGQNSCKGKGGCKVTGK